VTTGYPGKVTRIADGDNGSKVLTIKTPGGKAQRYTIEAGATIPDEIVVGKQVAKDARLAAEVPRDYRWVEIESADGARATRAEIKSHQPGQGWIQRGTESSERGAAAEAAAMAEADEALQAAKAAGDVADYARLPHQVGGGGFDDVIVEFAGKGDDMTARIRIREVKDYPNRHVPLDEFTALNDNWAQNLEKLNKDVREAVIGEPPKGYEKLDADQLKAIRAKLNANDFEVEIRLGESTKIGAPGHHASTTLPALEKQVGRKINVRKIGEGDR
jgi:hypothetical protein